ncbi:MULTISPECIES: GTP 3',8-cyclase MoaA [unclassified Undibacterium]|uniref:GTP 3',8-cyclase MoaA n=1 Tax=unclassified Undibacterium TaxID=2630295 RepID=UPI002AC916E7|nr:MULTISPECIES: GTP 3',8-cyclase MoaA [unclassified Undibacterium]MEB0138711.1 GTP 3',8-cyclase MoaA [Undibacterium sp. CCC2.1]MEB0171512.1 GTP 3',8-cyclase MoaA [Undibacterium sp. CCC1.1]MEB0175417.1 GTP 3',8-cyclase MoaA [Undibacterium sp. CCC3.4]MEB0214712.1 GTP 3',8-cyclase MoaA [Undibacterium sp. 5I2]WPX43329.1 GTP 3',8-cyclase MoaA [Undibacterium sp. CCC3.4]
MKEIVIPLIDARQRTPHIALPEQLRRPDGQLRDTRARPLHDLRISVTDRCNFRCVYCMPKHIFDQDYAYLPQQALLSFEEITRVAAIFLSHGVRKLRLTGGEPLLRKNIEKLVAMLAQLRTVDGVAPDLTLTTNGSLLAKKARALKEAGLTRVSVSLDSLDETIFRRMNDVDFAVADVLAGIDAAAAAGLGPIKINMVVKAGVNDAEVVPMVRHFRDSPHILRLIEYMDVGTSNAWQKQEVISSQHLVERIVAAGMPLVALPANYRGETAERWQHSNGHAEIGFISSVSHAFCGDCSRARLSTEGKLYTCLFASAGHDLRALLRGPEQHSDLLIANVIAGIWQQRSDRYSELRSQQDPAAQRTQIEMSYIGG